MVGPKSTKLLAAQWMILQMMVQGSAGSAAQATGACSKSVILPNCWGTKVITTGGNVDFQFKVLKKVLWEVVQEQVGN